MLHNRSFRALWLPGLLASLTLFSVSATGCGSDEAPAPEAVNARPTNERVVRVQTQVVRPTTFEDVVEITGTVDTPNDATLSAQIGGTVTALTPRGKRVAKGGLVAELDDGMVRAAVRQAEAQVATARAQYDLAHDTFTRQQPLYQDSIISALEFEGVRAQLNQATAQLSQAEATLNQIQEQLKYTRILAPFEGTIEEHFVERGEQVMPGTPVARIVNTEQVKVKAGVPERYAGDIGVGTPVQIRFQAYGVSPAGGQVSFVGRVIDPSTRTFPIEVDLDNRDGRLKPAMIASLFVTRARLEDRLVVPQTAVIRDENGVSMFVVSREDTLPRAQRRTVRLGPSYAGKVVVEAGLEPGTEIIVVGQNKVTEGDAVEVVDTAGPAPTD